MTFKVWCADETEDDGKTYPRDPTSDPCKPWARDADDAAEVYADYCHSNRDGWEWSWPADFMVRDMASGIVLRFSVDRETVPEFHAGKGTEVKVGPHDLAECECRHEFGSTAPCDRPIGGGWGPRCTCVPAPGGEP